MLVNVEALSRGWPQLVENNDEPNGLEESTRLDRWGIEPALKRDNKADVSLEVRTVGFLAVVFSCTSLLSLGVEADDLKGVVAGVALELLFSDSAGLVKAEPLLFGNLEGTVPARARRVGLNKLLSDGGIKSGNPS